MFATDSRRCNPIPNRNISTNQCDIQQAAFYKRLRERGKLTKVALVAVMRKLVSLADALLRANRLWQPSPPPRRSPREPSDFQAFMAKSPFDFQRAAPVDCATMNACIAPSAPAWTFHRPFGSVAGSLPLRIDSPLGTPLRSRHCRSPPSEPRQPQNDA